MANSRKICATENRWRKVPDVKRTKENPWRFSLHWNSRSSRLWIRCPGWAQLNHHMDNSQDLYPGDIPTFPQEKEKTSWFYWMEMTTSTCHKRILMHVTCLGTPTAWILPVIMNNHLPVSQSHTQGHHFKSPRIIWKQEGEFRIH